MNHHWRKTTWAEQSLLDWLRLLIRVVLSFLRHYVALWLTYDYRHPAYQIKVVLQKQTASDRAFSRVDLSVTSEKLPQVHIAFCCFKEPSCSAPLLAQTRKLTHHALLKTVPYNSCHRKTRWVRHSRIYFKSQKRNKGKTQFYTWNLSLFFSTKSEKGPLSVGLDPSDNASRKMAPEREKACRKTEVSNSLSESGSSGCTAGKLRHRKS